ncbi:unnamed protein product [Sympodiomycopsis kandeliae]
MTPAKDGPLLSPDNLAAHVQTCQVIFAMWGGEGELQIEGSSEKAIEQLGTYLSLPINKLGSPESVQVRDALPSSIDFALAIDPFTGTSSSGTKKLVLDVSLALRRAPADVDQNNATAATRPRLALRQAEWLTRTNQEELRRRSNLQQLASQDDEDGGSIIMTAVENVSEAAIEMQEAGDIDSPSEKLDLAEASRSASSTALSPQVLRTWHHLISLSTKEKRDDLVSYAQSTLQKIEEGGQTQPLTGFVLAGKPGLVVLECPLPGAESAADRAQAIRAATNVIDGYWSSIKSRSWADIPAVHKKVTETHREEYADRAFQDMKEITGSDEIGGKEAMRGGWRNDMSKVEQWLKIKGIGGRMGDVFGAEW